jgi:hypothetical protein
MAATVVLDRIAAWERSGAIDHELAKRLRAIEAAEAAAAPAEREGEATPPAPGPVPAYGTAVQTAPASRLRSSGFILEFFVYLGGLFVLLAWYAWFLNELPESEEARNRGIAVATFVPALVLGSAGWLLAARADERLRRAAAICFAVAVPSLGVAAWALLQVVGVARDGGAAPEAAGAAIALALAVLARVRCPSAITQATLLATWGVFALTFARWVEVALWRPAYDPEWGDVVDRSADEQLVWNVVRLGWWWLVAAIPAIVMVRRPDRAPGHQSRDAVARVGIGVIAVLGSASAALATFDWTLPRGGEPIFGPWLAAAIMVGVGAVFVVAARASGSRIHLVTAGAAILVALTYLNAELVVDAVGAPAALLVEGVILLGVATAGWAAGRFVTRRGTVASGSG